MTPCEHFQPRLLDHLYGLLDDADSRALRDHLETCTACRAAQQRAEAQRQLLAAAAKEEFAGVRFAPPTASAAPRRVATPRGRWGRWAVAAAVLLALAG